MAEEHKVDYHAGIVAALKVKYDDQYDFMETIKELILGEKPPRLDAVLLKKDPLQCLSDEVGCFFKEYNVIEFKGFGDGISINDFYKAQGYALMYMTIGRNVNEIPIEKVTITIFQYRYPKKTFKLLEDQGCTIKRRANGIYEIFGQTLFPYQVIDIGAMDEEWITFKILVPGATKEQIEKVQDDYEKAPTEALKQHLEDVLRTSFESNADIFNKLKEEGKMSEAIRKVFREEIHEEAEKEKEEAVVKMIEDKVPARNIAEWFGWTVDKVAEIATKHGFSTLTL